MSLQPAGCPLSQDWNRSTGAATELDWLSVCLFKKI